MSANKGRRRWGVGIFVPLVLVGVILSLGLMTQRASAADYPGEDGPLRERISLTGKYRTVAAGAGLELTGDSSFSLNVPGNVVAAYLYWAGATNSTVGDNTVTFQVDANAAQSLTADDTFGPSDWFEFNGQYYHFVFVREVTALVQPGTHTYRLTDFTVSGASGLPYGFGLVAVYEDPALPDNNVVTLLDGSDSVWWGFTDQRGSPSSMNCLTFVADPDQPRVMDYYVFVGGSEDENEGNRPNSLHYVTGSGTPPITLVDPDTGDTLLGTEIMDPFTSADGPAWDTYTNSLVVNPGDTYVCFQTQSDQQRGDGASFLWLMGGTTLREQVPTAVSLSTLSADNNMILPAAGVLSAMVLAGLTTGLVLVRRRTNTITTRRYR